MRIPLNRLVLLAVVVGTVFSPAIFAELATVDDFDMYHQIADAEFSFRSVFFPQSSGGAYYRPMIGISYLFDKYVWLLDTRLMHLDNIFFHLLNSCLVYVLAGKLLPHHIRTTSAMPLAAALLFALHPITSESVNWISGRTDIFACTFVLLSTLALLMFRETGSPCFLLLAALVLIPGLLVKETPMAFVLCAIFILSAADDTNPAENLVSPGECSGELLSCALFSACAIVLMVMTYAVWPVFAAGFGYLAYEALIDARKGRAPVRLTSLFLVLLGAAAAVWMFFFVRSIVFRSSLGTIPRTVKLILGDLNYALQTFLGGAGFYVKKFFLPLPLNLAIREIDPLFNLFGVVVFMFCLYMIRRNTILTAFCLSGVCLFLPALPLSLGTVTWTAYAERYIYMSTAFWVISTTLCLGKTVQERGWRLPAHVVTVLVIGTMAAISFQRSITWQTNLSLWRDTVAKSPAFKMIRLDYMMALMNHGDFREAERQYQYASAIPSVGYFERLDLAMAALMAKEHNYEEAARWYEHVIAKTRGESALAYELYVQFLQERIAAEDATQDASSVRRLIGRELECLDHLYRLKNDPMLLYRAGQVSLRVGDCVRALMYFSKAKAALPPTSEYSGFAGKLVTGLARHRTGD
jgi:hypothetical protein